MERIPAIFASLYEKASRQVVASYYRPFAEEIAASCEAGTILDLGTGPGFLPAEIVKRSPALRCVGIDLSPRLIEAARRNAAAQGAADRLEFEVGDAARLRFDDSSFDMVISTGMLHMVRDPIRMLGECHRVLKPGGEAWVHDPAHVSSRVDVDEWKASFSLLERISYLLFKLQVRLNPARRYRRGEVEEMIRASPFETFSIEEDDDQLRVKLKK